CVGVRPGQLDRPCAPSVYLGRRRAFCNAWATEVIKMAKKKTSQKRDTVKARSATMYAKRDEQGEFRERDEQGRSLAADRRQRAKRRVASGYGDQGDRASAGRSRSS